MTVPRRLRTSLAALLLLALPACVGSPQPSPPNLTPDAVRLDDDPATDRVDGTRVIGEPGAVEPPEGAVVVTPLDDDGPPSSERVRADGSFEVVVPFAGPGDALRIQIRNGGARSEPLDVAGAAPDGRLVPIEPLACLVLDPAAQLDVGDVRLGETAELEVTVVNECAGALTFAAPRLREPSGPFALVDAPSELEPGASGAVTLTVTPTESGVTEQTLFVEATAPTPDRRPVTLFVVGTE